jgi:hypothetical protein
LISFNLHYSLEVDIDGAIVKQVEDMHALNMVLSSVLDFRSTDLLAQNDT